MCRSPFSYFFIMNCKKTKKRVVIWGAACYNEKLQVSHVIGAI